MKGYRIIVSGAAVVFFAVSSTVPALASGGASIAAAPTVAFGQQEFGNTATDDAAAGGCDSWWLVPTIAGDHLTVDWESMPAANGNQPAYYANLYPVGTDDFDVTQTAPVASGTLSSNNHQQLTYVAPRTGTMPLDFTNNCGNNGTGPYDFFVYVSHQLILNFSAKANRARTRLTFRVAIHNPDGGVVTSRNLRATYEQRVRRSWVRLASVSAPFAYTKTWKYGSAQTAFRVVVAGPGYRTATRSLTI